MLKGNWDNSKNNHGMSAYFKNNTCQRNGWIIYMNTKWLFFVTRQWKNVKSQETEKDQNGLSSDATKYVYAVFIWKICFSRIEVDSFSSCLFSSICSCSSASNPKQTQPENKTLNFILTSHLLPRKKTRLFFQVYFIEKLQTYINRILGCS